MFGFPSSAFPDLSSKRPFHLLSLSEKFSLQMTEPKTKIESLREWVADHKLRTVGALWLTGIAGSIAYNWSSPKKFQVKVIHARLNAQAITLAALFGSAVVEYYDHRTGKKADKVAKYMHIENFEQK